MKTVMKLVNSLPKDKLLLYPNRDQGDEYWFKEGATEIRSEKDIYYTESKKKIQLICDQRLMSPDAIKFFQKAPEIVRYLLEKLKEKEK